MDGDRDGAEAGSGEHHHGVYRRNAAAFCDELGLARIVEADIVELRLGYRTGDNAAGKTVARQPNRNLEAVECATRAGKIRISRGDLARIIDLDQRQGAIKGSRRVGWCAQCFDGAIPYGVYRPPVADGKEGRQVFGVAGRPSRRDDFRTDPGRIAHRHCQRRGRRSGH